MKAFEVQGVWWLPENPKDTVPGVLKFNPSTGAHLTLFGCLTDNGGFPDILGESPPPLMIHGVGEGKQLTLLRVSNSGSAVSMPGIASQYFRSGLILEGALVGTIEEILFTQLVLDFTHLADWAQLSGLSIAHSRDLSQATFRKQDDVVIGLQNGVVRLSTTITWNSGSYEYSMFESSQMIIDLPHDMSFEECWKAYIHPLRNFMTISTTKPNFPTLVKGKLAGPKSDNTNRGYVKILFGLSNRRERESGLSPGEMLFGRLQAGSKLQQVLDNWFRISAELEPVCDLLFGTEYNQAMYTSQRFLNLVQGLEAYHRRRFPNEVLPAEQHRSRVDEVVNAAPKEHQAWLKEALRWSNEPSLKQRLVQIFERVGQCVSALIPDGERFIRRVRDTRNYLTHFDPSLADRAARGQDLYRLTLQVRYLLIAVILQDIGFSEQETKRLLESNQDYIWLCREA